MTAVTAAAMAEGISPGMGLADASALEPALLVEEADFLGDAAALTKLTRWCDRFSPWATPCGSDGIFLDVTGCAHLFGDEAALAAQAVAQLARQGIAARAAIADTLGAAWAVRVSVGRVSAAALPSPCRPAQRGRRSPICRWRRCGSSPKPRRC